MSEGAAATCPRCHATQPPVANFCHRCGHDHRGDGADRRAGPFVARPSERVRTPNAVTTLLPMASGRGVRPYEVALAAVVAVPVLAAAAGLAPFAIVAAAAAVPALFAVYLYDVNEWDDQPVPVVAATLAAGAVLGAAGAVIVDRLLLAPADTVGLGRALDTGGGDARRVVVTGVVAPLLALVLAALGPLWLASRPRFDDLLDGLTFGAVAGAAYAAGETLIAHRGLLAWGRDGGDAVLWMSIVANAAFVKPIVFGAAVALAVAAFSGVGAGYDGFTGRFARAVGVAAAGLVAYGCGVAVLGRLDGWLGAALGLVWGVVVAGMMVVVLRTRLQVGVLEAALESIAGTPSRHEVTKDAYCGECELPLAPLGLFCNSCGASVRATSKTRQRANVAGIPT